MTMPISAFPNAWATSSIHYEVATRLGAAAAKAGGSPAVDHFPWVQIIPVLPELLALALLIVLLLMIGPARIVTALSRVKKIAVAGLEIELADDVQAAAANKDLDLSDGQARRVARILSDAAPVLSCSRLLWVDDNPINNAEEMRALRRICVHIDLARSSDAAREALGKGLYDLVISDMRRGQDERAGMEVLKDVKDAPLSPDVIYYVGERRSVPEGAFGLTVRPDELFRLIVDALRSRRG